LGCVLLGYLLIVCVLLLEISFGFSQEKIFVRSILLVTAMPEERRSQKSEKVAVVTETIAEKGKKAKWLLQRMRCLATSVVQLLAFRLSSTLS